MNKQVLINYFQLSPENTKRLEQEAKVFQFDQAGPVIHKGQAISGAFIVLEGELRVYTYSPKGSEATLYTLTPGDTCVLTLNCLFNNLRYPAWVEARPGSQAALIPGDLYRRLFAEEDSVRDTTVKALSTLVFRLMDELEEVHSCTLEQRLALYFLNQSSSDGVIRITQQQLGDHLGTSREVIARLIQNFTSHQLIKTSRGKIIIENSEGLLSLVQF